LLFALIGVALSLLTGNGIFDGIATLAIGALLGTVAVLLAVETKSLIIGESAVPEQLAAIETALLSAPGVDRVIHLRTMHLGPDELLLAAKIAIGADDDGAEIAAMIDNAEARVRAAVPTAKVIYLEPDIYRPDAARSGT
jgi:divalent metal cation (Fe/Co/Zn/Cd) transporter